MAHRWPWAALTAVALLTPGLALAESPAPAPTSSAAGEETGAGVPDVLGRLPVGGFAPTPDGVADALRALLSESSLGDDVAISVLDVATGAVLFTRGGTRAATPASTTKVLTAAAALAALGPDAVLRTRVLREDTPDADPDVTPSTTAGVSAESPVARLLLVGGGDPLLSSLPAGTGKLPAYPRRASLVDLARQTVAALRSGGIDTVRLRYDDTLFIGPDASPRWERSYTSDVVARVHALAVDQGRIGPLATSRVLDPAATAAGLFAAELRRQGVTVRGEIAERVAAASGPEPGSEPSLGPGSGLGPEPGAALAVAPALVAEVLSPSISALVEHTLVTSDNDAAEALARHIAIARSTPASFDGAAQAVLAELAELGIDVDGARLFDGSGLSRENLITPQVIAATLAGAAADPRSEMRALPAALAIAGANGTLALRFAAPSTVPARGLVRAKSGFLTGVVTLGGLVVDTTGRLLAFDVAADAVSPGSGLAARAAVDRVAAVLARCGCR
ncbi:MAG: D-alanyl-D-alanine carboxypeptidase/D-alanyl-D-alanine endopeptidase [Sporichthyaceae bacterium]